MRRLKLCNIDRDEDQEEEPCFQWKIFNKAGITIGEFDFLRDEQQRIWINNCWISDHEQRKGIGSNIIRYAVSVFGAIYFCKTPKEELIGGKEFDSRYLTPEGVQLVESCIRKKIIKPEWFRRV